VTIPFIILLLLSAVLSSAADKRSLSPIEQEFENRVQAYMKVHKQAASKVPDQKEKTSPAVIEQRELAFAQAIRNARPNAQPGDIFTEESRPLFGAILKSELKGKGNQPNRDSIKEGNPKHEKAPGEKDPVIQVNAVYPKNSPLSSVPPDLLARLPKVPDALEYRFVGRTLILRDRDANIIVDYIREAAPKL
jgi:hypothetical protein